MPKLFSNPDDIADSIISDVGRHLVVGLPLGLGKANHIVNALYRRAAADRTIKLTLFSALTLEKPRPTADLERRFINPVIERLFGGYPDLDYAKALHAKALPPNIDVVEFFFLAGRWMNAPYPQQHYISANYTHAAEYLLTRGVNLIAQLVAKKDEGDAPRYSLSSNTDLTLDLMAARTEGRAAFKIVAQVNSEMPFMPGQGDRAADDFHAILDSPETDFPLFAPPSEPISDTKYAIGLHAAGLVRDGGSLQIGIGQVGDALSQALILRHRDSDKYLGIMRRLAPDQPPQESGSFAIGLYGVSEMFFEAFLGLIEAGVLKREVDGAILHAAFFLGPKSFYRALREMAPDALARIQMMAVSFTNQLYGNEPSKLAARIDARFVNNAMMATLMGAVISDGLENGQVVSGVGGQYNFVAQAFALPNARSILTVEASRGSRRKPVSNIRWSYGHTTIPRHLRDIVITEYGVADLRGRSDAGVIEAMLAVSDSRFQDDLMRQAKDAGKLPKDYVLPAVHRDNTPGRVSAALRPAREDGLLPSFPFGSDFTDIEQRLIPALELIKGAASDPGQLAGLVWRGCFAAAPDVDDTACLQRLGLDQPSSLTDMLYRMLVSAALVETRKVPAR